jgi:hypothetical protein
VAMFDVWGLVINVVSSALTGSAVWLLQRALWRRRLRNKQRFFGLSQGAGCLLVVNRHMPVKNEHSVNRRDVAALLELSALLHECGARAEILFHDQPSPAFGAQTEFCIGGPESNTRTVAHLRWRLPGVTAARHEEEPWTVPIRVGGREYARDPDVIEYVLLAKIAGTGRERPVFLVCGQTAVSNQAAVRHLVSHHRELARTYGPDGRFCLVIRILDPPVYGPTMLEVVADVTADAFSPPSRAEGGDALAG